MCLFIYLCLFYCYLFNYVIIYLCIIYYTFIYFLRCFLAIIHATKSWGGEYKVSRIHSRIALGVLTSICWFSLHLGTFGPWMAKRNLHARACWYLSKSEAKRTLVACWTTMTIWYLDIFRRKRSACLVLLWTLQISSNDEHAISQGDFCGAQVFASSTITVAVQT